MHSTSIIIYGCGHYQFCSLSCTIRLNQQFFRYRNSKLIGDFAWRLADLDMGKQTAAELHIDFRLCAQAFDLKQAITDSPGCHFNSSRLQLLGIAGLVTGGCGAGRLPSQVLMFVGGM